MHFGVFSLLNIEKATPSKGVGRGRKVGQFGSRKARYIAKYVVTTRSGSTYEQKFYPGQESRIPTFLANVTKRGGTAARVDTALAPPTLVGIKPPPEAKPPVDVPAATRGVTGEVTSVPAGVAVVTEAEVAERKLQHENDIRYKYERLGEKVSQLDPSGYKQALALRAMDGQIQQLKQYLAGLREHILKLEKRGPSAELTEKLQEKAGLEGNLRSLTIGRDKMLADFNRRPLSWKLIRIVGIKEEMAALKKEGAAWIASHEKEWKRYLRSHAAKVGHMAASKKKEAHAPLKYPPHIQAQLNQLAWKLKGTMGTTVAVPKKAPKLGVGENLVVVPSKELGGATPDDGAVSYLLTAGQWKNINPNNGKNQFTPGATAALWKEFEPIIHNIVMGRAYGEKAAGWARQFDLEDLAENMKSRLMEKLFELAAEYTPEMAKDNLAGHGVEDKETGKVVGAGKERSFRSFAIMRLNGEAKNLVRGALNDAKRRKDFSPEEMEAAESLLAQDEEGLFTRDQLRDQPLPIASHFASPEDLLAIQDVRKLFASKIGRMESLGILSRANLLNPEDKPEGGGGLKSWDAVAKDVQDQMKGELGREGVPSTNFIKQSLIRRVAPLFKPGAKWVTDLTANEKTGLKEGLKALIRVVGMRQVSTPDVQAWRVSRAPTKKPGASVPQPINTDIHRVVAAGPVAEGIARTVSGHMRKQVPLLVVKPEVHDFWKQQARSKAKHFDPASELGLGMDVYGPPSMAGNKKALPLHVRLKQMRAKHYVKVWKQMSKMNSKRLARLSDMNWVEGHQFAEYSRQWEAAQAASAAAVQAQVTRREDDPTLKKERVPFKMDPLVIKLRNGTATIEGVPPGDILKMARLIVRQRDIDSGRDVAAIEDERDRQLRKLGIRKADEDEDLELAALFLKMRRLLKVG